MPKKLIKVKRKKKVATRTSRVTPKKPKSSASTMAILPGLGADTIWMGPAKRHGSRRIPDRWKAYYAMGVVALGVALVSLIYQESSKGKKLSASTVGAASTEEVSRVITPGGLEIQPVAPSEAHLASSSSAPMEAEFKEALKYNFDEKIAFWSRLLESSAEARKKVASLAISYSVDDIAPLVPNHHDCTTFVETVAALARSSSADHFIPNLLSIRYEGGQPGFVRRNHFPEADWIPNNQKAFILTDITATFAKSHGFSAEVETKTIDRAKWFNAQFGKKTQYRKLASTAPQEWSTPVEAQVPYIGVAKLKEVLNDLPNGAVLNLVHKDDGVHPVLITHQGFVIKDGNRIFLRHASKFGRIRTSELHSYLQSLQRQSRRSSFPLIGVNLNQIMDSTSATSLRRQSM